LNPADAIELHLPVRRERFESRIVSAVLGPRRHGASRGSKMNETFGSRASRRPAVGLPTVKELHERDRLKHTGGLGEA
jgi:hypothetical protein